MRSVTLMVLSRHRWKASLADDMRPFPWLRWKTAAHLRCRMGVSIAVQKKFRQAARRNVIRRTTNIVPNAGFMHDAVFSNSGMSLKMA